MEMINSRVPSSFLLGLGSVLEELLGAGDLNIQGQSNLRDVDEVDVVHVLAQNVIPPRAAALRHRRTQPVRARAPCVRSRLVHQYPRHRNPLAIVLNMLAVIAEDTRRVMRDCFRNFI